MKKIAEIVELLHGAGEVMPGAPMSNDEAVNYVLARRSQAVYCIVRDWVWIDLDMGEAQSTLLQHSGRLPVIAYASTVIFDSARRFDVGDFVRTSPLVSFEENFLFKTANSIYLLLGEGQRKRAALTTVARIF